MFRMVLVFPLFLASLANLSAEIAPPRVEIAAPKDELQPFRGKVLERFKQGFPPPISTFYWQDAGGFYEGFEADEKGKMVPRWSDSFVKFQWSYPMQPLKDSPPMVGGTEGLRVLRNEAGEICQLQSGQFVVIIERMGSGWKVTYWAAGDTVPTPGLPQSRTPISGKSPLNIRVLEEVAHDSQTGVHEVVDRRESFDGRYSNEISHHIYRNNDRESVSLTERYNGKEMVPANLESRIEWVRTRIPDSNHYRQTIRQEIIRKGKATLTKHVTETWSVADDGSRSKVEEKDHLRGSGLFPADEVE